jgi:hypothetical protein
MTTFFFLKTVLLVNQPGKLVVFASSYSSFWVLWDSLHIFLSHDFGSHATIQTVLLAGQSGKLLLAKASSHSRFQIPLDS